MTTTEHAAHGLAITTDNLIIPVALAELSDYQACVGGLIQPVELEDGHDLYVNEEGKLDGLPVNAIATDLALLNGAIEPTDVIVGNVVLVGPLRNGESTDLDFTSNTFSQFSLIAEVADARIVVLKTEGTE